MPNDKINELFEKYPDVIAQMPKIFTSHQFILRLAQQHQVLYIEALHSYRNSPRTGKPAPFRVVHQKIARHLHAHPEAVKSIGNVPSVDIFGQTSDCAQWRRL